MSGGGDYQYRPLPATTPQMDRIEALLTEIRDLLRAQQPERFDGPTMGAAYDPLAPTPPYPPLSEAMLGDDARLAAMQAIPLPPARPAGSSKSVDDRPDPVANPGATNPDVTQENMATTIFVSGWTSTVRPRVTFTNALKAQQLIEYGYPPGTDPSQFEEDHIVPLECGGAPHDAANLWPQPRTGQWGARCKDLTENAANAALRSGAYSLQEIQDGFKTNWKELHAKLFSNPKVVGAMMLMAMEPLTDEP